MFALGSRKFECANRLLIEAGLLDCYGLEMLNGSHMHDYFDPKLVRKLSNYETGLISFIQNPLVKNLTQEASCAGAGGYL